MIRTLAAVTVLGFLSLLMAFVVVMLVVSGQDMTGNTGPIMAILGVLAVCLSVGLTERRITKPRVPDQDEPPRPRVDPALRRLLEGTP